MQPALVDHPVIAALAALSAAPIVWSLSKAFLRSAADDVEGATRDVFLFWWFPEWPLLKLFWLLVVTAALVIFFYKVYAFLGGFIGLVA
jgi:hypothetical protein